MTEFDRDGGASAATGRKAPTDCAPAGPRARQIRWKNNLFPLQEEPRRAAFGISLF